MPCKYDPSTRELKARPYRALNSSQNISSCHNSNFVWNSDRYEDTLRIIQNTPIEKEQNELSCFWTILKKSDLSLLISLAALTITDS
jgi:hypothetical protein